MVHRPGLEHTRLTPSNAEELLFDDVLWVARAKAEHDMFCEAMRDRGVEVFEALKLAKYAGTEVKRLEGKEIALIFEKTSTRTRSAFEVGAYDQGAHVTYLDPSGSQLGHKESVADTAAVLGRMYDAIEYRGNRQADVEALAANAGVPVYNQAGTARRHRADHLRTGRAAAYPRAAHSPDRQPWLNPASSPPGG